jgi:hypothetical protein
LIFALQFGVIGRKVAFAAARLHGGAYFASQVSQSQVSQSQVSQSQVSQSQVSQSQVSQSQCRRS